jgi:alpha-L-fucosidase 2
MREFIFLIRVSLVTLVIFFATKTSQVVAQNVVGPNWSKFLSGCDIVYDDLGTSWNEGLFTGNGLLGTMIYRDAENGLRIDIGRSDVRDHQAGNYSPLLAKARLPIGHFLVKPVGKIIKVSARLDLWNAEVKGTIYTDKGTIEFRNLTFSESNIIYYSTIYTAEESGFAWKWVPEESVSTRTKYSHIKVPDQYRGNPAGKLDKKGQIECYNQSMTAGGGYATAWERIASKSGADYLITIAYQTQGVQYAEKAIASLNKFKSESIDKNILKHREWWHTYYPQSFLSLPDLRMQSFYWLQQYKLASATRADQPALDLMGPWFKQTPWPAYWFNLNIQLSYSPLYAANRLGIATSLMQIIDQQQANLIKNVPKEYQHDAAGLSRASGADLISPVKLVAGSNDDVSNGEAELSNLTWILYYYWQHYRYSMDQDVLKKLFPLLKRSINYPLHLLRKGDDGKWHFSVKTHSPEYPIGKGTDTNYDLSLLNWGCKTLLQINEALKLNDPLETKWKDVLENLVPYPKDENGYRIAADVPFNQSHRHYSHLLMVYPLYLVNWDQEENRELISKSLKHWHSFPAALQGYSFTGGASMYAMMGKGDSARDYLNQLLDKFVQPNTMYLESGPVIETPLAAATSIQELYLQYWADVARVFPAIPSNWKNAAFQNLRTEGAFLLSAVRKNGKTCWVKVESLKGGNLAIKPGFEHKPNLKSASAVNLSDQGKGVYTLSMPKGAVALLYVDEKDLNVALEEAISYSQNDNSFGKLGKKK